MEIASVQIVIVHFDPVVFSENGLVRGCFALTPRVPGWRPQVHHDLGGECEEVDSVCVDSFANEMIVDVPGNIVGGPL